MQQNQSVHQSIPKNQPNHTKPKQMKIAFGHNIQKKWHLLPDCSVSGLVFDGARLCVKLLKWFTPIRCCRQLVPASESLTQSGRTPRENTSSRTGKFWTDPAYQTAGGLPVTPGGILPLGIDRSRQKSPLTRPNPHMTPRSRSHRSFFWSDSRNSP